MPDLRCPVPNCSHSFTAASYLDNHLRKFHLGEGVVLNDALLAEVREIQAEEAARQRDRAPRQAALIAFTDAASARIRKRKAVSVGEARKKKKARQAAAAAAAV
jgi:hypothetical protein